MTDAQSKIDKLASAVAAKIAAAADALAGKPTGWLKIFAPGTHNGVTYSEEDCRLAAANYDPTLCRAKAKLDHVDSGPSAGQISEMRYTDGWVECRLVHVPDDVREAVAAGKYDEVSVEIVPAIEEVYPEASARHGVKGMYITGLALLGAANAAVPGQPPLKFNAINNLPKSKPSKEGESMDDAIKLQSDNAKLRADLAAREKETAELKARLDRQSARDRMSRVTATLDSIEAKAKRKLTPALRDGLTQLGLHCYAVDADTPKVLTFAAEAYDPKVDATLSQIFEALAKGIAEGAADLSKVFAPPADAPEGGEDTAPAGGEGEAEQKLAAYRAVVKLAEGDTSGDKFAAATRRVSAHLSANPKLKTIEAAAIDLAKGEK
jgi:hypothetical protein